MTVKELYELAGEQWRYAKVCFPDANGHIAPAMRVSFHRNESGGIAVVLHDGELRENRVTPPEKTTEEAAKAE